MKATKNAKKCKTKKYERLSMKDAIIEVNENRQQRFRDSLTSAYVQYVKKKEIFEK